MGNHVVKLRISVASGESVFFFLKGNSTLLCVCCSGD